MAKKKAKAEAYDYSQDAGMGFENVGSDDLGIPFIKIIQSTGDELDEDTAKFIDGAKAGMIFNSSSREILGGKSEPIVVIPCSYNKAYNEWRPNDAGGGLVMVHRDPSILAQCERDDKNNDVLENGNHIVTTSYIGVLVIDGDGDATPAVISFTSTQLKKSKQWLSIMNGIRLENAKGEKFKPSMFSHKYHLSTIKEENAKGSWYGWKVENAGLVEDIKLIEEAKVQTTMASKLLTAGSGSDESGKEPF